MGRIFAIPALLLLLVAPLPARAQTPVQTVVVPAGGGVVIGPRSQAAPRSALAPPTRAQQRFVVATPTGDTLAGPSAAAAIGLAGAAALAVILGGTGSNGSGGASPTASVRTR
jgi:hypothetical protein